MGKKSITNFNPIKKETTVKGEEFLERIHITKNKKHMTKQQT